MARIIVLVFAVTLVMPASRAQSQAVSPNQSNEKLSVQINVEMAYLLYKPKDYDQKDKWPLVLFLHGSGERGSNLDLVKVHGPPKLIAAGKEFPAIVVSPQFPRARGGWEPFELTALLDTVVKNLKVDESRIYVTGLSMGGFGTWALANHTPNRFAAIAPICGGGDPRWARSFRSLPIWVFHGAKDTTVLPARSEEMVNALKDANPSVKYTVYPDAGHDSWTQTYDNPEFFEWLFAQKRP